MADPHIIKPIETVYRGHRFRSRLEARWGVFFDFLSIQWEYEPEGFILSDGTKYLPDFWLPQVKMYAEVKPEWPNYEETQKMLLLSRGSGFRVLVLDGPPDMLNYWTCLQIDPQDGGADVVEWCDVILEEGHNYHLNEHRFYSYTGAEFPHRERLSDVLYPEMKNAVHAARAARFDGLDSGGGQR